MKVGCKIHTPRFLNITISEIFHDRNKAHESGFYEPTHYYDDPEYDIYGKHTGENRMIFAAVRKTK